MLNIQDVDYLYASTRVRALEKNMLTSRDIEKMLECATFDEAFKTANDISLQSRLPAKEYEKAIGDMLKREYELVYTLTGTPEVFSLFRYKYDGHNIKVIVKSQAVGSDPMPLMSPLGLIEPKKLCEMFTAGKIEGLPQDICSAAFAASEALAKTHDPQLVDTTVDFAVLSSMNETAEEIGFPFLTKLVKTTIDLENLRTAVRLKRMGREVSSLKRLLVPGGTIDLRTLFEAYDGDGFEPLREALFPTDYYNFLSPAFESLSMRKPITGFERQLDNYTITLLRSSRLVAFGLEPIISYLLAKENEAKLIRIVLASREAGVEKEKISERLREAYA